MSKKDKIVTTCYLPFQAFMSLVAKHLKDGVTLEQNEYFVTIKIPQTDRLGFPKSPYSQSISLKIVECKHDLERMTYEELQDRNIRRYMFDNYFICKKCGYYVCYDSSD